MARVLVACTAGLDPDRDAAVYAAGIDASRFPNLYVLDRYCTANPDSWVPDNSTCHSAIPLDVRDALESELGQEVTFVSDAPAWAAGIFYRFSRIEYEGSRATFALDWRELPVLGCEGAGTQVVEFNGERWVKVEGDAGTRILFSCTTTD